MSLDRSKPWTTWTIAQMRAHAASLTPPLDLTGLKRKADIHAAIVRAERDRVTDVETPDPVKVPDVETPVDPPDVVVPEVVEPEIVEPEVGRADGRDPADIMDAWHKGEAVDEAAEDVLDAVREATGGALVRMPTQARWVQINEMAQTLHTAAIVRAKKINRPDDMAIMLLAAHDLGISVTAAIQGINLIDGRPSLSAQMMVALVRTAGFSITPKIMTSERAVAHGVRGEETCDFEFTMAEAEEAELTGKDNWQHYPKAMLWARAVSGLCRILFPDVLAGLTYTPEELGANVDSEGFVIDVESRVVEPTTTPTATAEPDAPLDLVAIKAMIDALPEPVRIVAQANLRKAKEAGEIPGFADLTAKHWPTVDKILTDAERLASTTPRAQPPVEETVTSPLLNAEQEAAEPVEMGDLAARAREIAAEAQGRTQPPKACVACGKPKPLDEFGMCDTCEPF